MTKRSKAELAEALRKEQAKHRQTRGQCVRLSKALEQTAGDANSLRGALERFQGLSAAREEQLEHLARRLKRMTLNRTEVPTADIFVALSEVGKA